MPASKGASVHAGAAMGALETRLTIRNSWPRRRGGFTLIETIVTVGLLAVLAAFVVPTVIQKAGAADPVKVSSDLAAIRSGLETFISDVKGGYPNQLHMLTDPPTGSNHYIDSTTGFTAGQIAAWNGPYIGGAISPIASDSIA